MIKIIIPEHEVTESMRAFASKFLIQIKKSLNHYEEYKDLNIVVKPRKNKEIKVECTLITDKKIYRRVKTGTDFYLILPNLIQEIEKAIYKSRSKYRTEKRKI